MLQIVAIYVDPRVREECGGQSGEQAVQQLAKLAAGSAGAVRYACLDSEPFLGTICVRVWSCFTFADTTSSSRHRKQLLVWLAVQVRKGTNASERTGLSTYTLLIDILISDTEKQDFRFTATTNIPVINGKPE